jgi:uncharacterized protein YjbJ (UPF0337 family)
MNWDRMEGEWKQRRGIAMHHWGKVMNDDLAAIAGKYEEFVGRLQERYGIAREEANQQVRDFKKTIQQLKKSNSQLMRLQKSLRNKGGGGGKRASLRNHLKKATRSRPSI